MTERHVHLTALEGSYLTPSFEHAKVADAMRHGVISCPADTTVAMVARTMVTNHVHCIVITGLADDRPWGFLEADEVLRAAGDSSERHAGWSVKEPPVTVTPEQPLVAAAELLAEHRTAHLLVVDSTDAKPIGVLSTLDILGIVAWGRG